MHQKKIQMLIIYLLILSITPLVFGRLASQQEMENVCQNWLTEMTLKRGNWAGETNPKIISSYDIIQDGQLLARSYNISPRGHIVVPVLKEMPPVKVYSDKSNLDTNQEGGMIQLLKEVFSSRYELYRTVYGSLDASQGRSDEVLFGLEHTESWNRLSVTPGKFQPELTRVVSEAGPLLTSSWHQREPYNNDFPMGDGGRCITGCVPLATAQIMNYWQWPPRGPHGLRTWIWGGDNSCGGDYGGGEVFADFSDDYDWANMLDNYEAGGTSIEQSAVAELCYETSFALMANFGYCGSGAFGENVEYVLKKYFRYKESTEFLYRINHTLEDWFDIIRNEIDNGRPIYYGVYLHAIVCDGYRDQGLGELEYHMNYGWGLLHGGVSYDVWYVLDNLYCFWVEGDLCPYENDKLIRNIIPQTDPILKVIGQAADDISGDDDGHADAGESVEINVIIENRGNDAINASGELTSSDPYVTIVTPTTAFESSIPFDESGSSQAPFVIDVDPVCPDPHIAEIELNITADGGYSTTETIYLFVGDTPGFSDDMEGGEGYWKHYSLSLGYIDEWHLTDAKGLTGSLHSWKAGGAGADNYSDLSDGVLISPPFLLPENAGLSFWHWITAENSEDATAWDGGNVYILAGNGEWTPVSPFGGYPYTIINNETSPFEAATPCYSGFPLSEQQAVFDLSQFSGVTQIMFRFGSDLSVTWEGWYIDDVSIFELFTCGDVDDDAIVNILDIVYLINYKYKDGPEPVYMSSADVNSDQLVNILDIVFLINYKYKAGPEPACQ